MMQTSSVLATYRLQFHKGFPFAAGAALAGYLRKLGVSHVYASPVLAARAGSQHGYDVVDHNRISPDLGGEDGFRAMAHALRREGLGVILDIVPNHMAVGGDDNPLWLDLLKHGRASRYADWFDVDFTTTDPWLAGRIHAPFLGEDLESAIAQEKFSLTQDPERDGFALRYGEHLFPLRTEDDDAIRRGDDVVGSPERMRALIGRQHYRPDCWRNASDRINWRRFFDVTQLGAIRIEHADAFEGVHRLPFAFYAEGLIDGLRIDHIDGLADPAAYCQQVRARLNDLAVSRPAWATPGPGWLVVEKILAPGETLPDSWPVDGATGYDFMDQASALIHAADGARPLGKLWSSISARPASFHVEEHQARAGVLERAFGGQLETLVSVLMQLAATAGPEAALPRGALRRAVSALACNMRAYRSYLTGGAGPEEPGPFLQEAFDAAMTQPLADHASLTFVMATLCGRGGELPPDARAEAVRRFNQLTAPLAARSVEDTAFYRFGRLLSRNDVGFDASCMALDVSDFHAAMAERAARQPHAMLALATHDHKRGADVRARLAMISHDVAGWRRHIDAWFALNARVRPPTLDAGDEYQIYQMLLGLWPHGDVAAHLPELAERMSAWVVKAMREAKLRSDWFSPDAMREAAAVDFINALLDPARSLAFQEGLGRYLAFIGPAAALNGLVQVVLQCTVPGAPDTYQGTEFWDLSAVDPDNRRPVDFGIRQAALDDETPEAALAANWMDGRIKQWVLQRLLRRRQEYPALFTTGRYQPLAVQADGRRLTAFCRESEGLLLAVLAPLAGPGEVLHDLSLAPGWWRDVEVELPAVEGGWEILVGGATPDNFGKTAGPGCHVLFGRAARPA